MQAAIEMYKTTRLARLSCRANELSLQLKKLQAAVPEKHCQDFFIVPFQIMNLIKISGMAARRFIGLSDLVQMFPEDNNAPLWKSMVKDYAEHYLLLLSRKK